MTDDPKPTQIQADHAEVLDIPATPGAEALPTDAPEERDDTD
ncbi:hypothetical protein ACWDUN_12540 [Mycobacterium sp. NPDC003323]